MYKSNPIFSKEFKDDILRDEKMKEFVDAISNKPAKLKNYSYGIFHYITFLRERYSDFHEITPSILLEEKYASQSAIKKLLIDGFRVNCEKQIKLKKMTENTANGHLTGISEFYKCHQIMMPYGTKILFKNPEGNKDSNYVPTDDECLEFYNQCTNPLQKAYFLTCASSGLGQDDINSLTLGEYKEGRKLAGELFNEGAELGSMCVIPMRRGKTSVSHYAHISVEACVAIDEYIEHRQRKADSNNPTHRKAYLKHIYYSDNDVLFIKSKVPKDFLNLIENLDEIMAMGSIHDLKPDDVQFKLIKNDDDEPISFDDDMNKVLQCEDLYYTNIYKKDRLTYDDIRKLQTNNVCDLYKNVGKSTKLDKNKPPAQYRKIRAHNMRRRFSSVMQKYECPSVWYNFWMGHSVKEIDTYNEKVFKEPEKSYSMYRKFVNYVCVTDKYLVKEVTSKEFQRLNMDREIDKIISNCNMAKLRLEIRLEFIQPKLRDAKLTLDTFVKDNKVKFIDMQQRMVDDYQDEIERIQNELERLDAICEIDITEIRDKYGIQEDEIAA